MLILIRLATAFGIFVLLFCVLFVGCFFLGAGIAGARAGTQPNQTHEESRAAARQAGRDFARNSSLWIFLGSFGFSAIVSTALSFTGILPWCRKPEPPRQI
jgi:hypothetical protein